jgi:hypothetical protein
MLYYTRIKWINLRGFYQMYKLIKEYKNNIIIFEQIIIYIYIFFRNNIYYFYIYLIKFY